ncbi:MAG: DsbA family protein [Solirubrobacteraceae bacterium]
MADQPTFYYDLGSPGCYLVAERVMSAMPVVPEWEPVLARALGFSGVDEAVELDVLAARAAELELQPLRWPAQWPPDTEFAMLAATYAKHIGRAVAFSLAAFRQAFAGGRDLGDQNTVLIAAAACEMHPTAVLKGASLRSVASSLVAAGERARVAGVRELPSIQVGERVFSGEGAPEQAALVMGVVAE